MGNDDDSLELRRRYPADITGVLTLRMMGAHVVGDNVAYHAFPRALWLLCAGLVSIWHITIVVQSAEPWRLVVASLVWTFYFIATSAGVVNLAHFGTQGFLEISIPLWETLTPKGRAYYRFWYSKYGKTRWQLFAGLMMVALGCTALWFVQDAGGSDPRLVVLPPSYAVVAASSFLIGTTAYWAATGVLLCWRLSERGRIRPYAHGAAYTPGIEGLSRLLLNASSAAVALVFVLLFPILYSTSGLDTPGLTASRTVLIGICGAALVALAIVPQAGLSRAIRDSRQATMRQLLSQFDEVESRRAASSDGAASLWNRLTRTQPTQLIQQEKRSRDLIEEIGWLGASPTSTLGTGNIVQILASAAGILIPIVASAFIE